MELIFLQIHCTKKRVKYSPTYFVKAINLTRHLFYSSTGNTEIICNALFKINCTSFNVNPPVPSTSAIFSCVGVISVIPRAALSA